jgi:hypothetical protein
MDNKNIKKQQDSTMAKGQMETPKSATQASEYTNANKAAVSKEVSKENARGAMAGEEGRGTEKRTMNAGEHDHANGKNIQSNRASEERSASHKGGKHGSR